jgi:uncharacterized SAM-binding protein YcdF (DUF218 family)
MKKYAPYALVLALLVLQFFVFHAFWFGQAGGLLIHQDEISPADAILVLGGGSEGRVMQGVELYKKGYGSRLMFTGMDYAHYEGQALNWAIEAQKLAIKKGVPAKNTLVISGSSSTHEDAALSKSVCEKNNFSSLIVITDPFHTGRSYLVFKKVYQDSGIKVMLQPVIQSEYQKNTWWQSERSFVVVYEEYIKTAYYLAKGYI